MGEMANLHYPEDLPVGQRTVRRRSSILAGPLLTSLKEIVEDSFQEQLHFDHLCLGGGIAAARWCSHISKAETNSTAAVITAYPQGMFPYSRDAFIRDVVMSSPPHCSGPPPDWYQDQGVTVLHSCQAVRADLDGAFLAVNRVAHDGKGNIVYESSIKISYGKLVIATGACPRSFPAPVPTHNPEDDWATAKLMQAACFLTRHPDLSTGNVGTDGAASLELRTPKEYGFGSVHYIRDAGDAVKLAAAASRTEEDGQEPCQHPIVLVARPIESAGPDAGWVLDMCALAMTLSQQLPDVPVSLVIDDDRSQQGKQGTKGLPKDVVAVYERMLTRAGVAIAKGYTVKRLWGLNEVGTFPFLESSGGMFRRSTPRPSGKADAHWTTCRGLVLQGATGEDAWMKARFVVAGTLQQPNSHLFRRQLELCPDGSIATDDSLRTSHHSNNVYAVGDVCSFPLGPQQLQHGNQPAGGLIRSGSEHFAAEAGSYVADVMLRAHCEENPPFAPLPALSSTFGNESWCFAGVMAGEAVTLGLEDYRPTARSSTTAAPSSGSGSSSSPSALAVFWVIHSTIVGCYVHCAEVDYFQEVKRIAAERPGILSIKQLKKAKLHDLLADPYMLSPPPLGIGEFHADHDPCSMNEVLKEHESSPGKVPTRKLGDIMEALGADWDEHELKLALKGLDPQGQGEVAFDHFSGWWRG